MLDSRRRPPLDSSQQVHSGTSGGAVLDADTGQLLGLVTSNARFGSRTFPQINFSIPMDRLQHLFKPPEDRQRAGARGLLSLKPSLDSGSLLAAIEDVHDPEECRWAVTDGRG